MHRNTRWVTLVDVIEMLSVLNIGAACHWDRKCSSYGIREYRRLLTVRTPLNEDIIIVSAEREPWRSSRDTAGELGRSHPRVLRVLHDNQMLPYHHTSISKRSSSRDAILPCVATSTHCWWTGFMQLYFERRSVVCTWECLQRPQQAHLGTD
jgi:hypothetical protein